MNGLSDQVKNNKQLHHFEMKSDIDSTPMDDRQLEDFCSDLEGFLKLC